MVLQIENRGPSRCWNVASPLRLAFYYSAAVNVNVKVKCARGIGC